MFNLKATYKKQTPMSLFFICRFATGGSYLQNKCLCECEPPVTARHTFLLYHPLPPLTLRGGQNKKPPLLAAFCRHSFVMKIAFQHSPWEYSISLIL